ncbi:MFS transporter [Virgibacillus soli]
MQTEKLWTKDFMIVSSINFLVMLVMYLLMVVMGPYAKDAFHASPSLAGLVSGIFIIGTLFGRLMTGRIIEQKDSKLILLSGLIFFIITTVFYFFTDSLSLLLANRLLNGIGMGVASTATGTMVAQVIPSEKRGEGIGYFSMSTVLATAIGPFLGIFLSQHTSFSFIFGFCLALGLFSLVVGLMVKSEPVLEQQPEIMPEDKVKKRFNLSNFIEFKALPIALVTVIASLGYAAVLSFLAFFAEEVHLQNAASFFFLVYAVAVLLSRPFTGKLMDMKGANIIVYPALILMAVGLFLLSAAEHGMTLLFAGAIIGLGFGNFQSCAQAIAIKVCEPHRLGLATSTYFIALDFGIGIGPYMLGHVIPFTGYTGLYLAMAVVAIIALIVYVILCGQKTKADEQQIEGV